MEEPALSKCWSFSHVWFFVTPWTGAYQAPLSMGFSRQEYWSGFPFPPPGDIPDPVIKPGSPALQADSLPPESPGKLTNSPREWEIRKNIQSLAYEAAFGRFNCSVQLLSHFWLFVTPWTAGREASSFIINSRSLLRHMSIELVIPSNHLILCNPLLLLPSIFPSIRVFKWVSSLHQVSKVLEFQLEHQFFQWIFRTDFL